MASGERAFLRLVPSTTEELRPSQWFCGHCGAVTDETPAPAARICGDCGLGMLLEARADVVPQAGEAFLIVDASLSIQALSAEAEHLLAITEHDVIQHPVTELLTPADAEARGAEAFATTIMHAARGDDAPQRLFVRPANVFGVRMPLRVGLCGPPRAALLVLE
ncbi:PAS domain-containing protein [Conexibacter woesei]|uniref:PAS domain-containing protein n=1 Tax=Conexibacter woesei (strain DSM 14684 / CCUG 47730 / CIP 108061 / JCM 11494 / NBRC 100937 / ID131577) TaxID=469383 RepID=D3F663_CONWI|nr:PAS domain-containing protein [Conexibacter woesei]ADB48736.1 hypothetical protein Cwoe_0300 [Conexibacter woesei DSM 14684]